VRELRQPDPEATPAGVPAGDAVRDVQAARGAALTDRPRRAVLLGAVAAAVLLLDVLTKVWVVAELEGQRRLEYGHLVIQVTRNPGAAFSFGESLTYLFTAAAVGVIVFILWFSRRVRSGPWALSLGLLLGGASGNLVDRLLRSPGVGRGAVVDFLDFQVWPSFNVADSGIVVGGLLAVLLSFRNLEVDGTRSGDRA
jgi:signal peptidase II